MDLLRQAFAEDLRQGSVPHREADFEPLWSDPRFRELMRPKD